jgi:glycosyltransferase involved in cell wall biosynthesis
MSARPEISIVVPVFNEEESLELLYAEVRDALEPTARSYELILVDDCSTDRSLAIMRELRRGDPRVRVLHFQRNFGQTAALSAGFDAARGCIVVTMDGDLQNDPADIPRMVARIDEGFDIVAGWRKDRQDGFILRRLPSQIANRMIAWLTDTPIHDTGCTLKAFRASLVRRLPIYAEQHRFLPAMSRGSGARVTEMVVHHRARRFGHSKYGIGRAQRVLLDMFAITLIARFARRPLHYFFILSMPFGFLALALLALEIDWRVVTLENLPQWPFMAFVLCLLPALHFLMLGLLSELVVNAGRVHKESVLQSREPVRREGTA